MDQELILKIHRLKFLVEADLYPKIDILKESTEIKDIKEREEIIVNNFLEDLSDVYTSIPNYKEIVYNELKRQKNKNKGKEAER